MLCYIMRGVNWKFRKHVALCIIYEPPMFLRERGGGAKEKNLLHSLSVDGVLK